MGTGIGIGMGGERGFGGSWKEVVCNGFYPVDTNGRLLKTLNGRVHAFPVSS
jgi:hypothetical protein